MSVVSSDDDEGVVSNAELWEEKRVSGILEYRIDDGWRARSTRRMRLWDVAYLFETGEGGLHRVVEFENLSKSTLFDVIVSVSIAMMGRTS